MGILSVKYEIGLKFLCNFSISFEYITARILKLDYFYTYRWGDPELHGASKIHLCRFVNFIYSPDYENKNMEAYINVSNSVQCSIII